MMTRTAEAIQKQHWRWRNWRKRWYHRNTGHIRLKKALENLRGVTTENSQKDNLCSGLRKSKVLDSRLRQGYIPIFRRNEWTASLGNYKLFISDTNMKRKYLRCVAYYYSCPKALNVAIPALLIGHISTCHFDTWQCKAELVTSRCIQCITVKGWTCYFLMRSMHSSERPNWSLLNAIIND